MKRSVWLIMILSVVCAGLFHCAAGRVQPSWSDIYLKKAPAAKGWKYIVIHHSATDAGSAEAFHKYHTDMGYGGLSYHFVIGNGNGSPDGAIEEGFRWEAQMAGTHVDINSWYHNIFGIGICLVGNFEKDRPTQKQLASLKGLIKKLAHEYNIPDDNIIRHGSVPFSRLSWDAGGIHMSITKGKTAQTHCPGKYLPPWDQL